MKSNSPVRNVQTIKVIYCRKSIENCSIKNSKIKLNKKLNSKKKRI